MKKRKIHLLFYAVYCLLGLAALTMDFGVFSGAIVTKPFVYYTSISNMLCTGFMMAAFVRSLQHGDDEPWDRCKFLFVVMILLTAIVYNLLLNSYDSMIAYFAAVKNALHHLILPVLFFLDWIIFYKRGKTKPLYPVLAVGIPMVYVAYILLRGVIVRATGTTVAILYPYFFLNIDSLGWQAFAMWMAILLVALLLLGYTLYGLDRLLCRKAKQTT